MGDALTVRPWRWCQRDNATHNALIDSCVCASSRSIECDAGPGAVPLGGFHGCSEMSVLGLLKAGLEAGGWSHAGIHLTACGVASECASKLEAAYRAAFSPVR